ncbi:hypothetical protein HDG37_002671 [Paraburkholderia sp. MM5384-R2]|nr:hypothetical protein [Paraburkholderia sp. MM5384-R2]
MPRRGRRFFWFFCSSGDGLGFFRCSGFVGLSLLSCRSISVAPVRGGTYFLCCCKESRQRRQLKPLILKRVPWFGAGSGASGIRALAHSPFVTKPSSLPLRTTCVADGSAWETNGFARAAGAVGCASAMRRNNRWFLNGVSARVAPPEECQPCHWRRMCGSTDSRCTTTSCRPRDPLKSLRFELSSLPTFFAAAKKVGAAPHRGNANRPITKQGKANQARTTKKA